MKKQNLPDGWDEAKVKRVIAHYENQTDDEAIAEVEAALKAEAMAQDSDTRMSRFIEDDPRAFTILPPEETGVSHMGKLTVQVRTDDDLRQLLAAEESAAWIIGQDREQQITHVQIVNFAGTQMIEGVFDRNGSRRRDGIATCSSTDRTQSVISNRLNYL